MHPLCKYQSHQNKGLLDLQIYKVRCYKTTPTLETRFTQSFEKRLKKNSQVPEIVAFTVHILKSSKWKVTGTTRHRDLWSPLLQEHASIGNEIQVIIWKVQRNKIFSNYWDQCIHCACLKIIKIKGYNYHCIWRFVNIVRQKIVSRTSKEILRRKIVS